jgi:hypothetical protein
VRAYDVWGPFGIVIKRSDSRNREEGRDEEREEEVGKGGRKKNKDKDRKLSVCRSSKECCFGNSLNFRRKCRG